MPLESARAVQWLIAERLGISIDSMMMVDVGAGEGLSGGAMKRPHQLDQRINRFSPVAIFFSASMIHGCSQFSIEQICGICSLRIPLPLLFRHPVSPSVYPRH